MRICAKYRRMYLHEIVYFKHIILNDTNDSVISKAQNIKYIRYQKVEGIL